MTLVTVTNKSPGLRSFPNLDNKHVVLKPGETKSIELAAAHIRMLEREAASPRKGVEIAMSANDRKEYEADVADIVAMNKVVRAKSRHVRGAQVVPPTERRRAVDRRHMDQPQTSKVEIAGPKFDAAPTRRALAQVDPAAVAAEKDRKKAPVKASRARVALKKK